MTMRALRVTENGAPGEVARVENLEIPEPGPGQVRIRVAAGSLNFNDIDRCRGRVVTVPTPVPFTLGMDACGVADAAGDGAEAWVGRRVVAITHRYFGNTQRTPLDLGKKRVELPFFLQCSCPCYRRAGARYRKNRGADVHIS